MNKQILLKITDDYIVFEDSENSDNLYCVTKTAWQEQDALLAEYGLKEQNVPASFFIKVLAMGKVGERDSFTDEYGIINKELIDFPINRIKHIFIRLGES